MAIDPEERPGKPIARFESMLKTDDVYFFDAEDFEDIIHHYLNQGKVRLAKKAIQLSLEQHPNTTPLKLLEVEVMVFENRLEEAVKQLNQIEEVDGTNEEVYIQRANIYSKKDDHPKAIDYLKKALEIAPDQMDIYALMGMEYLFLDDFEQAKHCFIQCVEDDPEDYASLYNVVYCFEFLEDFEGAIEFLNDYLEQNPYCEVAWHQLGKQYVEKTMFKEALTAFDFAIISDDTFTGAYFEKAMVLEKLKRYNEAIENYQTTLDLGEPSAQTYLRLGQCHEALGLFAQTEEYYTLAVNEDPLLERAWLSIAQFHLNQNASGVALDWIQKALQVDDENPNYWETCAMIYASMDMHFEADFACKQSVAFGGQRIELWLMWAQTVWSLEDPQGCVLVLEEALELYVDNTELHLRMAVAYHALQDMDKASFHLEQVGKDVSMLALAQTAFPYFWASQWTQTHWLGH